MRAPNLAAEPDAAPQSIAATWSRDPRRRAQPVSHNWRELHRIAAGGCAEVFRAVDDSSRPFALKRLRAELRERPGSAQLLHREHGRLVGLAGPHLVATYGLVDLGGHDALVLDYLPGGDLVPLLGAPARAWLPAMRDVLSALLRLHAQGVAHGDLKARNVLFGADGSVCLIDLTSARPVDSHDSPAGITASHYPPAAAHPTAAEADVFAWATLLYELMAGRLPYGLECARRAQPRPELPEVEARVGELAAAAVGALAAGGRVPGGLLSFADVIESAAQTCR